MPGTPADRFMRPIVASLGLHHLTRLQRPQPAASSFPASKSRPPLEDSTPYRSLSRYPARDLVEPKQRPLKDSTVSLAVAAFKLGVLEPVPQRGHSNTALLGSSFVCWFSKEGEDCSVLCPRLLFAVAFHLPLPASTQIPRSWHQLGTKEKNV